MKRTLTIEEWHALTAKGVQIPMRIPLTGNSMFPLVRYGRDHVNVAPLNGSPAVGDIVLFTDPPRNRYVMHRVWQIKDGMALTWGDNCVAPDGWMPVENLWGKAVSIERGKRIIQTDPAKGMKWAAFWHRAGKAYRFGKRIKEGILRRIKRIIK